MTFSVLILDVLFETLVKYPYFVEAFQWSCCIPSLEFGDATVDGRNPAPVEFGSLSHFSQGFIHLRWFAGFLPSTV